MKSALQEGDVKIREEKRAVSCWLSSSLLTPSITGNILVQWPATAEGHAAHSPSETVTRCVCARTCVCEIVRDGLAVHINSAGEKERAHSQYRLFWYTHLFLQTISFPRGCIYLSNSEQHLTVEAARHVCSSSSLPMGLNLTVLSRLYRERCYRNLRNGFATVLLAEMSHSFHIDIVPVLESKIAKIDHLVFKCLYLDTSKLKYSLFILYLSLASTVFWSTLEYGISLF